MLKLRAIAQNRKKATSKPFEMPILIFGLGNPGPRYAETRHNAGFWFLDRLADVAGVTFRAQSKLHSETARTSLDGHDCILAKPTTFMNHSGQAVRAVMDYYKASASRVLIAYDELDLPPGVVKLKQGGGHGGHNGLRDIINHLGDKEFFRLRVGIGHPGDRDQVVNYVLHKPSIEDRNLIEIANREALEVMPLVFEGRIDKAMQALHTPSGQQ